MPATDHLTVSGNTILSPFPQTAIVFMNENNGCTGGCPSVCPSTLTFTRTNLVAGGWVLDLLVQRRRNERRLVHPESYGEPFRPRASAQPPAASSGGNYCTALGDNSSTQTPEPNDGHGYYPNSGFFGLDDIEVACSNAAITWTGNVWDDNNTTAPC